VSAANDRDVGEGEVVLELDEGLLVAVDVDDFGAKVGCATDEVNEDLEVAVFESGSLVSIRFFAWCVFPMTPAPDCGGV
jgi:hypothetical protein